MKITMAIPMLCGLLVGVLLSGCGGGSTQAPPRVQTPSTPDPALAAAKTAAMNAAAAAAAAAGEAEAAVMAQEANRFADPDSYGYAWAASMRARRAAVAAANAADRTAVTNTLASAQRQRDIALAKRSEAETERDEAVKYAHMVRRAHNPSTPMERDALVSAAAAAARQAEDAWLAALAEVRLDKHADLDSYRNAQRYAHEEAGGARREAAEAVENVRLATTYSEANRQKEKADDQLKRAQEALRSVREFVAGVRTASRDPAYVRPPVVSAPVFDHDGRMNIGSLPPPPAGGFERAGERGGASLSTGSVRDGATAEDVLAYLHWTTTVRYDTGERIVGLPSFPEPPLVRLVEGTNRRFADLATRAVEIVNAALPYEKRLQLDQRPTPAPGNTHLAPLPDEFIVIEFAPPEEWPYRFDVYPAGATFANHYFVGSRSSQRYEHQYAGSSHILFNTLHAPTLSDASIVHVLVHELLHAFGFGTHTDPERFPRSTLNAGTGPLPHPHILSPVDRDALFAAYARFEPGAMPEDMMVEGLGPWEETSFHVRGELDLAGSEADVSFGVSLRNGLARPWASGSVPGTELADTRSLAGSATWSGALLGISRPLGKTVAGDARLVVDLATMDGDLDFTNLEQWGVRAAPGAAGSGARWGDGDLEYTIRVSGNDFVRTDGDAGDVKGAFFGRGHEGMGGVLERRDLAAGFGGEQ